MKVNKSRARIVVVAAAALLVATSVAWWLLGPPADPDAVVRRLWAKQGVEAPNVVLVTLDTTRADHLGCYGYAPGSTPTVDALARGGVLFTQAASVAPLTLPAHSSIMTGMYPTHHGVRLNGATALGRSQTTLAEILSGRGYATGAFVGAFVLDGRWGLNQGFSTYDDKFDLKKYKHLDLAGVQRGADQVMDAALAWLEGHTRERFFAWIHLYDPHSPYEPPEPFRSRYGGRGLAGLYDGEIAFADQQVGRLVSWLRANGLDGKTIVVVIGDHGEGLGSHGEGTHGYFVYDYATHVPLLVSTPLAELRGIRVDAQVSSVDVFPTLLALAGVDSRPAVQGRSLLPAMLDPAKAETGYAYAESMTPSLQFGWGALHCLRSSRYKLIEAPRPELYDLAVDPGETTNVFDRRSDVARDLTARLDRLVAETSRDAPEPESADLDQETVGRLAALGYIGSPVASKAADPSRPLADPKDKLEVFAAVQQAGELIVEQEYPRAVELLESALAEDAKMPQARLMLGGAYAEMDRTADAKVQYDLVLKDDPKSVPALVGVASLLMRDEKTGDVIALCRRVLALDERNLQAYALLGEAHADRGEPKEALASFEKAVEIQPKLTRNRLNLAAALIEVRQYDRADRVLGEVVSDSPRFPFAQFNRGLLYEEQGRLQDARAAYAAEVAAYPGHYKPRFNLGRVLYRLGDRALSLQQMREVVRLAPKEPEGYLFLARGLLQEGAPIDEVHGLVEKGLSLARTAETRALGFFLLADVYNRKGRPDAANEALRRAQAYAPTKESRSHANQSQ